MPSTQQGGVVSNRAEGRLRAGFWRFGARTRATHLYEAGGLRMRFPKVAATAVPDCEAVCINTAGGMVGGDRARLAFTCGEGASVTLTTQSAEKIYRSTGVTTEVAVDLDIMSGGCLQWLPQESILFDQVALRRTLNVSMESDATLLLVESLVFGRLAMGETVSSGDVRDRWRIRRGGRLVFAEDLRLQGEIVRQLDRPAIGGGARALATLLLIAPEAEGFLDAVREALDRGGAEAGASAWNGLLTVRMLSRSPEQVRRTIVAVLETVRGQAAPRVWQ